MYQPFEDHFGKFSPNDGTVDFYLRVNTLSDPAGTYLDYGAGRASWFEDGNNPMLLQLRHMQGKFSEVIAVDVDPVVKENRSADRCLVIKDDHLDLEDASVDVIVADYVIEHIQSPKTFAAEITRLLKPGGWFCARTPHKLHYIALSERVVSPRMESFLLRKAQPERKEKDVFEKTYKMNTLADVSAAFPDWINKSYCRRCDPAYYFGSRIGYNLFDFAHRVMPRAFSGNLFIFLQKPNTAED